MSLFQAVGQSIFDFTIWLARDDGLRRGPAFEGAVARIVPVIAVDHHDRAS